MRFIPVIISALVTTGLIIVLNTQLPVGKSKTPRLGYFLSPQVGFWQNAEPSDASFNGDIKVKGIKGKGDVYFDDRLVPHIYAETDADAYFIEGYLHAKFRLWQMEFQTHAAAGRLSEIVGADFLETDKYFRRLGMTYAAERSLRMIEENPESKEVCDAYTAGVNAYIATLKENELPLEYKLMDYKPEPWTNLKTALFTKLISFDMTGGGNDDLLATNTINFFGKDVYRKLFPTQADSLNPIVPKGTLFEVPGINPVTPKSVDSLYFNRTDSSNVIAPIIPNPNNGSNNWVVSGSKTKSGRPILCNDPHLGLRLPSFWYEIQITTPTHSVYGASFAGAPTVPIGFNENCAWGETNAGRDVKDFYEINFKDSTMKEYMVNGEWKQAEFRKEVIKVRGQSDDVENIAMVSIGDTARALVIYDKSYPANKTSKVSKYYAVRWSAHEPSNEVLALYRLNKIKNHTDYLEALSSFKSPGMNFAFASKSGDIAICQQGRFVAKWDKQGEFVMPSDTAYRWQGFINDHENPQMFNPARGYVSSANQQAVDTTYPYYLGPISNFPVYRGLIINRKLDSLTNISPADMMAMQTDNYNIFAEMARPVLLKLLDESKLSERELVYLNIIKSWDLRNEINEKGPTIFKLFWDSVKQQTWGDEYAASKLPLIKPTNSTLLESLIRTGSFVLADDITTPDTVETMRDVVLTAFKKVARKAADLESKGGLEWGLFKDTYIQHLARLPQLSRLHLPIGGGTDEINATTENHGPSWRMVVHLTDSVEAYGVYPGGQSGNPGSRYYDNFVDFWVAGKYYSLLFLNKKDVAANKRIKWHMTFTNA